MVIEFPATYFDGKTARAHAVSVRFDGGLLRIEGQDVRADYALETVRIEPPLGRAARVLRLRNGAKLETDALGAIAELEERAGINRGMTLVNRLEGQWRLVLACFVVLALFTAAFLRFGVPWLADRAAFATPVSMLGPITSRSLELLEGQYLRPSNLTPRRQAQLQAVFARVANGIGDGYTLRLLLRDSRALGANAFALPDGTVIMTDELVKLSSNDRELEGVLAHEVGHVIRRHGLRSIYQGAGVFLVVTLIAGDFNSVATLGASLPAILIQNGYSRQFEAEADGVAGSYMVRQMGTTRPLAEILKRLSDEHGVGDLPSFLSTHPGAAERAKALEKIERQKP